MKQKRGFAVFLLIGFISISYSIRLAGAQAIPKQAKIYNQQGNDYCDKGDFEKGVAEYEKAIKLYPRYTDALYNAGLTYYMDLKDYAKAVSYFRQFLQVEGDSVDARQVKKWLMEAGKKLADQQNAKTAQAKSPSSESSAAPSKEDAGQAKQPSRQAAISPSQQSRQAKQPSPRQAALSPSQKTDQTNQPPPEFLRETLQPPGSFEGESTPQAAPVSPPPPVPRNAPLKEQQPAPPSREEQARVYKEKGNGYNNQGRPELAVKEYQKALQIYPEYTDVLYNIAKTYDFNLKDYANAIRYYKQFLQYEPPSSRDAAQIKIWLGRAEEAYQAQNKPEPSEVAQSVPQQTKTVPLPSPATSPAGTSGARIIPKGKKAGDFYMKEFVLDAQTKAVPVQTSGRTKEQTKGSEPPPVSRPPAQAVTVAAIPAVSPSAAQGSTQTANREILIETIIPRGLRAADLIPVVMSNMEKEIVEVFVQARAQSPEKLAQLYLPKIQSDILPSGERISSFRLGGRELADLPFVRILTEEEKNELEKEKWELIRTRKSPARLKEVLTLLRDGYKVVPR
ncbi:MAG: tetratricopeptide repeat protein [bacterium]